MDFHWLWDSTPFLTRNHCGVGWTPWVEHAYKVSNIVISLAFFTIPVALAVFYKKKRMDLPAPEMLILFIVFIILCGLTHVSDVVVFYWAPYRLFTLLYVITAVASGITACMLPLVVRYLIKLPSREYVHTINDRLQAEVLLRARAEQELARRNDLLRDRVRSLEELLKANALKTLEDLQRTNQWIHERNTALHELNKMLSELEAL